MVNLKRTREDILSSVLDLIHHQGFQSTGLKELFTGSRTSSGSFYNYFQSKDERAHALIDAAFQHHLIQVFDEWQAAIAQSLHTGKAHLKSNIDPDNLAEQLPTLIEGALLMGRLYDSPDRLKRNFNSVRQLLRSALKPD
jgi:TetR/AcrR family transcriptional repressor of nem operon